MAEGGEVAELEVVVAFELVVLADGGEDFGLFDGVDAEVGFEVEVGVQQVGGVAGHLGDDRGDRVDHVVTARCRCRGPMRCAGLRWLARCGGWWWGGAGAVADPGGDVAEGGEVAELEVVVAFELVVLADGGEDFGLFDGVDAEVGFEVEVGVQQVGGVAGHLGDDRGDRVDDVVTARCRRRSRG